jgi:hypothetical protein
VKELTGIQATANIGIRYHLMRDPIDLRFKKSEGNLAAIITKSTIRDMSENIFQQDSKRYLRFLEGGC